MRFSKAGIILNTQNYNECTVFYGEVLGLKTLYKIDKTNEQLTCFELGDLYLMVETGGKSSVGVKPIDVCPTKFRFNVKDVETSAAELKNKGISIEVQNHDWGTTAEFSDPDGNRCALRSETDFGS